MELSVRYNDSDITAIKVVEFLKSLGNFEIVVKTKSKEHKLTKIEKSLKELEEGKYTAYSSVEEYFEKML